MSLQIGTFVVRSETKRRRLVWLMTNWWTRNPNCFTCSFRSQYPRTRKELFPVLSRIQNIGYELCENSRTAEWYRANHRTPWVATVVDRTKYALASLSAADRE